MSDAFYWGSQLPPKSVTALTDTARHGWSAAQALPYLAWMTNPMLPVLVLATGGALMAMVLGLISELFRLDAKNHAWSTVMWAFKSWRRSRVVAWYGVSVAILSMGAYFVVEGAGAVAKLFNSHDAAAVMRVVVLLMCGALVPWLAMRRSVVGDDSHQAAWFAQLAPGRVATRLGLLFVAVTTLSILTHALFGSIWVLHALLEFLGVAVAAQLLVRRDDANLKWRELFRWQTLSAFVIKDCYLAVLLIILWGPISAMVLLNTFLMPAIHAVYQSQGLALPLILGFEGKLSEYAIRYWWLVLPPILLPASWLLNARLVWQIDSGRGKGPAPTPLHARTQLTVQPQTPPAPSAAGS